MPKPIKNDEQAAQRKREEEARKALCDDFTAQLEAEGWTNVKSVTKATFYAISGDDPQGVNHSCADEDGQAAVDHLLGVGVAPKPRKPPVEPALSSELSALRLDGESLAAMARRLTPAVIAEFDKMVQLVMKGGSGRIIDDATGKTAGQRHGELSKLKDELARLGDKGA